MNKYLYIFSGFLIAVFIVYLGTRADFGAEESNFVSASGAEQQVIITKKTESIVEAKQELLRDTSGDFYIGNKHAPVLVIEYASLTCPHCAKLHKRVIEPLIKTHINTGKVKYVYRDFPLNAPAMKGSMLARCVGEQKFFSFIKVLFKSQKKWAFSENYTDILRNIAKLGGLNDKEFDQCMANKEIEDSILKQKKDAIDILEVKSTPTLFINGLEYEGSKTYEAVSSKIDGYLKGN